MKDLIASIRRHRSAYVFISPFFVLFGAFMVYPLVSTLVLSFYEWGGGSVRTFVGPANYTKLFHDAIFLKSLANAGVLYLLYVPLMTFLAIVFAVLVNSAWLKLRSAFRTIIYLPNVVSLVVLGLLFSFVMNRSYGVLNLLLSYVGIGKVSWLGDPVAAKFAVAIMMIWRWLGVNMIYMLAGLQAIPSELYEAASVDGAGVLVRFFRITIPMLQPVIVFALILSTIGTIGMFAEVQQLTDGGPMNSTITPVLHLYNTAFRYFKFGYASSMAYVIFVIASALSIAQLRIARRFG
jgi:lactose/L-arabinose transport system permease protein